ncbi:MAG: phosphate acetyltransferase [Nitrososphaerota archaeon]|nr:phosphate acetyltransferase [Nitrososphaerota archaeon]
MSASIIDEFKQNARAHPQRVALPESEDARILKAASVVSKESIAIPILIGKQAVINAFADALHVDLQGVEVIDPESFSKFEEYVDLYSKRKNASTRIARALLKKPLNFGYMMTVTGDAAAVIAGAFHTSAEVIAAADLVVGLSPGISIPSSFFLMVTPGSSYGEKGALIFADASVNPNPEPECMADIAAASAMSARTMLGWEPRIAMLSFSTKGSAAHPLVDKVIAATRIAREKFPDLMIDGELQADAALVPEVARRKLTEPSQVAGRANVLIFPDLNSGNIAYKLVERLAGAHAYGPILQGYSRPISDLSRGASVDDIVGTIAMLSVQAQRWAPQISA